jgi:peptidyl-prolyl cis-trans isomerase C
MPAMKGHIMEQATPLCINQTLIAPAAIAAELEWHESEAAARTALAVRELLRQRALELGLLTVAEDAAENAAADAAEAENDGAAFDAALEQLLAQEVALPQASEDECRRYYAAHADAEFCVGELVSASHILFASSERVPLNALRARAEQVLREVRAHPARFADAATANSNCPSAAVGGSLGQLGRGDSVPEFEQALFDAGARQQNAAATGILPTLVNTRYGFHIVRIDRRVPGQVLPFEAVQQQIAQKMQQAVFAKAFQQYIRLLAGAATITGVELDATTNPLVQ